MFICPFCDASIPETDRTILKTPLGFNVNYGAYSTEDIDLMLNKIRCPNCEEKTYFIEGVKEPYNKLGDISIYPRSKAKKFPEYIPLQLRNDYEEAYSILELSPKASATLSRRCLQGMIRDFFDTSKGTLNDEIKAIEPLVNEDQKSVLHALRQIGNVGAHLERDVNLIIDVSPEDAEKLLLVLEYFFYEWYISKQKTTALFGDITAINERIQQQRRS